MNKNSKGNISIFVVATALVALSGSQSNSGPDRSRNLVRPILKSCEIDPIGNVRIEVAVEIEKDWYMYANPVGNKDMDSLRTTLQIVSNSKTNKFYFKYPKGNEKREADSSYFVYQKNITFLIEGATVKNEPNEIEFVLRFFLCNERTTLCLPRTTVRILIPIRKL